MADNVTIPATGTGDATPKVAADELTYSGDTSKLQIVRLVHVSGSEGSKTLTEIADTNGLFVTSAGRLVTVTNELTRPADTTAYATNDSIADSTSAPTLRTFSSATRIAAGSGYIVGATLLTDNNATAWNNVPIRIWLYNTDTTPTLVNDNAAWNGPAYADKALLIGYVDFPGFLPEGGTLTAQHSETFDIRIPFVLAASKTALYGQYEIKHGSGTIAPASSQKFYCTLYIDQN